jgi:hypothetical protein
MKSTIPVFTTCLILLSPISARVGLELVTTAAPLDPAVVETRNSSHANFWGEVRFWRDGPKKDCNHFTTNDPDFILEPDNGFGRGESIGCVNNMPQGADGMTSAYAVEPGNFGITVYEKPGCNGQRCSLSEGVQLGRAPTCCIINGGRSPAWKSYQIV